MHKVNNNYHSGGINIMEFSKVLLATAVSAAILIPSIASAEGEFDGPYAGVKATIGIISSSGRTLRGPYSNSNDEFAIGGLAGFRKEVTNGVVLGVELDALYYTSAKDPRFGGAATLGYNIDGQGLAFVKLGYAKLDGDLVDVDGVTFGGGYERVITDQINVRAEYQTIMYTDFETATSTQNNTGHEISLSAIFKF